MVDGCYIFVIFGTTASFIDKTCSSITEAKREAILLFSVSSEVNSKCYSLPANQNAQKSVSSCVVYTKVRLISFRQSKFEMFGTELTYKV